MSQLKKSTRQMLKTFRVGLKHYNRNWILVGLRRSRLVKRSEYTNSRD